MRGSHTKKIVEALGAELMFDVGESDSFASTKAQHDAFVVAVSGGECFNGGGETPFADGADVFLDVFAVVTSNIGRGSVAVCPSPESDVGLVGPIGRIVAGTIAGQCEVGDFIMLHTCLGCEVDEMFVAVEAQFFVGFLNGSLLTQVVKRCSLLILERIGREMGDAKGECQADIVDEVVYCLIGQTIDEIKTDVLVTSFVKHTNRLACLFGCVTTTKGVQDGIVERLHAHAYSVDGGVFQARNPFGGDVVGISFDGDFGVFGQHGMLTYEKEETMERFGGKKGRRAATEVKR